MEKYSKWRDASTGIAPFLYPLAPTGNLRIFAPFLVLLAAFKTLLVVCCLASQVFIDSILLLPVKIVPPFYRLLSGVVNLVICRLTLFFLGFWWIPVEHVTLKRSIQSRTKDQPFSPSQGELIIANHSSIIELIYLKFRYNATFALPVSSTGSKGSASSKSQITSWRRASLFGAMRSVGSVPERSERGESLYDAVKNAPTAVVIFPEATTSNNRALLRFATLHEQAKTTKGTLKTYFMTFKYVEPSTYSSSATNPIPSSLISSILTVASSFTPGLKIRLLNPSECPTLSASPRALEMETVAITLASLGRFKRVNLDWEDKEDFLNFKSTKTKGNK